MSVISAERANGRPTTSAGRKIDYATFFIAHGVRWASRAWRLHNYREHLKSTERRFPGYLDRASVLTRRMAEAAHTSIQHKIANGLPRGRM